MTGWRTHLAALRAQSTASAEIYARANSAVSANRGAAAVPDEATGTIDAIVTGIDSPNRLARRPYGRHPAAPADAPNLLRHLRNELHCRVWLDGDLLRVAPTHRCPPRALGAALAVLGELQEIIQAEDPAHALGSSGKFVTSVYPE